MKHLNKYKLNYNHAWKYVQNNLDKSNVLSSELLNLSIFKNGYFFTLLPNDANTERIYEFESGVILPQNPKEEYFVSGEKNTYSIIPTIRNELSELLLKEIKSSDQLCCFFDDVTRSPIDKYSTDSLYAHLLFYEDEVYYLLEKNEISSELIMQCLRASNAFWHSLCVLTKTNFKDLVDKKLSLEKIKDICLNAQLIIIGAYDGEGYVFWEKTHNNGKLANLSLGIV